MFHVSFPGLGIHDLLVDRVAFTLPFGGGFPVYWYGICYAIAFALTIFLAMRQAERCKLTQDLVMDLFLAVIPSGLIGARLYYVAFAWDQFAGHPASIFNFRIGGMAFYGGVIGGLLGLLVMARYRRVPLARILDFAVVYLPLGQAIGRWGNFFNQEAFGTNTTLPWGMISEGTRSYLARLGPPFQPDMPVHPTFFYEFLGNLLIFAYLLWARRKPRPKYFFVAVYLGLYGLLRFVVEGLRTDSLYIGSTGIRVSQALSLLMVLAALFYALAVRTMPARFVQREERAEVPTEAEPAAAAKVSETVTATTSEASGLSASTTTVVETHTESAAAADTEAPAPAATSEVTNTNDSDAAGAAKDRNDVE